MMFNIKKFVNVSVVKPDFEIIMKSVFLKFKTFLSSFISDGLRSFKKINFFFFLFLRKKYIASEPRIDLHSYNHDIFKLFILTRSFF